MLRSLALTAALATAVALAAPPLLDRGPLPPGAWTLVALDDAPNPWPRVPITLEVADDGRGLAGSTGCNRIAGEVGGSADALEVAPLAQTRRACAGEEGTAEAIVGRVLGQATRASHVGGRLRIEGAGRTLTYAPAAEPRDPGVPGAPPVASSDRLDPARFAHIVDASAANRATWVRDPLQVALLFLDTPSSARSAVVRDDVAPGVARVRAWFDGLEDDAVRGVWFAVDRERGDDGAWRVRTGERASLCARGEVRDVLVGGFCP